MKTNLEEVIDRYLIKMQKEVGAIGAIVTGSYVTDSMGPTSDIDIFFVTKENFSNKRGREYFEDVEFEYFCSPEWKYYDRIRNDRTSQHIYANGKILLDQDRIMSKIQEEAKNKIKNGTCPLGEKEKYDKSFWVETVMNDGIDLYHKKQFDNFVLFTGSCLEKFSLIISDLSSLPPTYVKYGVTEIKKIDDKYGTTLESFLVTHYESEKKVVLWKEICEYVLSKLGNIDVKNYESVSKL